MPNPSCSFFQAPIQQDAAAEEGAGNDELESVYEVDATRLQESICCPVTLQIFKKPVKFNACTHRVEEDVAIQLLATTKTCPCCRGVFEHYLLCEETLGKVDGFLLFFPRRTQFQYQPHDANSSPESILNPRDASSCGCIIM